MRRAVWLIYGALCIAVLSLSVRRLLIVWMVSTFGQIQTVDRELHALQNNTVPAHRTDEGAFQEGEPTDDAEPQWVKPADLAGWRAKRAEGLRLYQQLAFAGDCTTGLRLLMAALSLPLVYGAWRLSPPDAGTASGRRWVRSICLFALACSLGIIETVWPGKIPGFPPELSKMLEQYSAIIITLVGYWVINFACECCIPYRFPPPAQPQHMPPIAALYVGSWVVMANMQDPYWKLAGSGVMTAVEVYYLWIYLLFVKWTASELAWWSLAPSDRWPQSDDDYDESDEDLADDHDETNTPPEEAKPRRLTEW